MSDNKERFETRGDFPMPTIKHRSPNEVLEMNKYQVTLMIERLLNRKPKEPRFEHVMIPLGVCLATIISLCTSNFKDFFGLKADVWQSIEIMIAGLSGIATIILCVLWLRNCIGHKEKSAEDIVKELIAEIESDTENLISAIHQKEDNIK